MVRIKGVIAPDEHARGKAHTRRTVRFRSISGRLLELLLQSSAQTHPKEFSGILSSKTPWVIDDLLLIPGTVSGDRHAIVQFANVASGRQIVGSVHSHPSPYPFPSEADLGFFSRIGDVHIIVAHPYTRRSWRAWSSAGEELTLQVVV